MQTFLPFNSIEQTVKCLDWKRLGKQRVEALQILNCLSNKSIGWKNHPAVKMWKGKEAFLGFYMNACLSEWMIRGYKNNMILFEEASSENPPIWFGDDRVHSSHRSNLLRKDSVYYAKFGWSEPADLPYAWPDINGNITYGIKK